MTILVTQAYTGTPRGTPWESSRGLHLFGMDFGNPLGVLLEHFGRKFLILDAEMGTWVRELVFRLLLREDAVGRRR